MPCMKAALKAPVEKELHMWWLQFAPSGMWIGIGSSRNKIIRYERYVPHILGLPEPKDQSPPCRLAR